MTNVERAHGVGRDKLDLDLHAGANVGAPKVMALLAYRAEDLVVCGSGEVEVHKAGTGDLHLGDAGVLLHVVHDCLGNGAGRHVGKTGGAQGERGGPVTVVGVCGALKAKVPNLEGRQVARFPCVRDGLPDELLNLLGHVPRPSVIPARPLARFRVQQCSRGVGRRRGAALVH